jgi:RNA polymerase I-specific transcription-initiation factor
LSLPLFPTDHILDGFLDMDKPAHRAVLDNLAFSIEQLSSLSLITSMKNIPDNSSLSVIYKRLVSKLSGFRILSTPADFLDLRQKTSFLIAAEICLSVAMVCVPTPEFQVSQTSDESQSISQPFPRGLVLSLRSSQSHSQSSPLGGSLIETQANSHYAQSASTPGIEVESRHSLLMRYVRFTGPIPGRRSSTARNLKHWRLGDNPLDYHYTAITRNLDLDFEISQMTSEERKKAAAKRQRLEQRRAKESARFMQSSQTTQNQFDAGYSLPSGENQALAIRPSQSLLKTALERNMAGSQVPLSSQASVGGSQPSRRKRKKGF